MVTWVENQVNLDKIVLLWRYYFSITISQA
jgi:hypothetical protein